MKNQAAFIPDNISNISSASQPPQNPLPHESTEFHPDSTDNLVEEILRQRAERLKKQNISQQGEVATVRIEQCEKEAKEEQQVERKEQDQVGPQLQAEPQKQPKEEFLSEGRPNNRSNGTISHSSFKEKHPQSPQGKPEEGIHPPNHQGNSSHNSLIEGSKHEHNEQASNKSLLNKSNKIDNEQVRRSEQKQASEGERSLQLNLSLSPSDKKYDKDNGHSSVQQKASSSSSKRNNKIQLEMNNLQQSGHSQQEDKPNIQTTNNLIQQEIGPNESKISAKSSILHEPQSLYADNKGFYDFAPLPQKNQTDRQLVKALTEHLDKIDNEELTNQKTFRKSEKQLQPALSRNSFLDIDKQLRAEEFQTDHSENHRENRIIEHRFESNLQYEMGQVREMMELCEALIASEECKQLRRDIKALEISNRREKIALRAASYTKIFNFHSPIPKNNARPIEFRTKFVLSERLAGKYHQTKKKIAEEKQLQAQMEEQLQVLSDYYDMMKQRKIRVYQQFPKEFQYNSQIEKYQTAKNSFFSPAKAATRPKAEYEFSKSRRTVEMQNAEVPYFQVLRGKKDISKDMMLEFEVWSLSKLKKLRDSNNLIRKEIQYVDQLIADIDSQLMQMQGIRKVKSSKRLESPSSRYHIEPSSKSINRSPQPRLKRPATAFSSPQKLSKTNSFQDHESPVSKTAFRRQQPKEQLLLIDSVQLDFSKRKAMRIFEQMDDYGISPIIEESKVIEDNPTLIKKECTKRLVVAVPRPESRSKGKNLVRPRSREIKTETSLGNKGGTLKGKSGKMSEQVSPQKTVRSQYYTSMEELYPK